MFPTRTLFPWQALAYNHPRPPVSKAFAAKPWPFPGFASWWPPSRGLPCHASLHCHPSLPCYPSLPGHPSLRCHPSLTCHPSLPCPPSLPCAPSLPCPPSLPGPPQQAPRRIPGPAPQFESAWRGGLPRRGLCQVQRVSSSLLPRPQKSRNLMSTSYDIDQFCPNSQNQPQ